MEQFLEQTEGTQPPTDGPSEQYPEGEKQSCHIETERKLHGTVYCLQCSDGAGKACCRAGIAVESRIAELFPLSRIEPAALKVQNMRVGEAKGDDLQKFSLDRIADFHIVSPLPKTDAFQTDIDSFI